MRRSRLGLLALLISLSFSASAQNNSDPLQALKDSMSQDDQQSVLQGVLGKEGGNDKKSDQKLKSPETVNPKPDQRDIIEKTIKTREGRVLRQSYEDPELRADDTVMIDLRSLDDICTRTSLGPLAQGTSGNAGNGQAAPSTPPPASSSNPLAAVLSAGGPSSSTVAPPAGGFNGLNGFGGLGGAATGNSLSSLTNPNAQNDSNFANYQFDLTRCPLPTDQPKTDDEKKEIDEFRKRILINNPYKLNRFGVLELPGLPSMPLGGNDPGRGDPAAQCGPGFWRFLRAVNDAAPLADR